MKKQTEKWMIEELIPTSLVPIKFNKSNKAVLSKSPKDLENYVRKPYDESYFEVDIAKETNQITIKDKKWILKI